MAWGMAFAMQGVWERGEGLILTAEGSRFGLSVCGGYADLKLSNSKCCCRDPYEHQLNGFYSCSSPSANHGYNSCELNNCHH